MGRCCSDRLQVLIQRPDFGRAFRLVPHTDQPPARGAFCCLLSQHTSNNQLLEKDLITSADWQNNGVCLTQPTVCCGLNSVIERSLLPDVWPTAGVRSVSRFFRNSRIVLRNKALFGEYPGVAKSS